MAAYRRLYDSRHLQADCQEPGSAPGYLFRTAGGRRARQTDATPDRRPADQSTAPTRRRRPALPAGDDVTTSAGTGNAVVRLVGRRRFSDEFRPVSGRRGRPRVRGRRADVDGRGGPAPRRGRDLAAASPRDARPAPGRVAGGPRRPRRTVAGRRRP